MSFNLVAGTRVENRAPIWAPTISPAPKNRLKTIAINGIWNVTRLTRVLKNEVMTNKIPKGLKYLAIAEVIQNRITNGDFMPGQQIPTQNELSEHFNTSRPTIEKAFDSLEKKGLIIRKKGSGTFVCDHVITENGQIKMGFLAPRPPLEMDFENNFINMVFSRISNESKLNNFTILSDAASFDDEKILMTHRIN